MNQNTTARHDLQDALWTLDVIARPPENFLGPKDMRTRIRDIDRLPPLPEMARCILELKNDPFSDAHKLARIIEMDPNLSAQVIRWASSPFYGFRAKTISIKDAIAIVLGFDAVFNFAFGLCSLTPMDAPVEGLLGRRFFWRQTLAGTALIQQLAKLMAPDRQPPAAHQQLAYLLHNTGHLLLAHLFRREFDYLQAVAEANPNSPLLPIERFTLGVSHTQLGVWLMQHWKMPAWLQTIELHHHNPFYRGEHEQLVWLVCLTDRLLGQIGVGDAYRTSVEGTELYENLGIDPDQAEQAQHKTAEHLPELDQAVAALF